MGKITILDYTVKNPLEMMGMCAGICWNSPINEEEKNIARGLDCLSSGHGRVSEYPQIYAVIDGYSAKVIRELYTHIGGLPSRLQTSTRYVDYGDFDYVNPCKTDLGKERFENLMFQISEGIKDMIASGEAREDANFALPLASTTKIVVRYDLRELIAMANQRMCSRALWEFRDLMDDWCDALREYSDQWNYIVDEYFVPKCEVTGFCTEAKCCGRKPKKVVKKGFVK